MKHLKQICHARCQLLCGILLIHSKAVGKKAFKNRLM